MSKEEELYFETQATIKYIENRLKTVDWRFNRTATIRESNKLFKAYLSKFKDEAFKRYDKSILKPYIIYRVNKYYHSLN
jgi:hypothetical protein